MKLLHYLIIVPLLILAVWVMYTADQEGDGVPFVWYTKPLDTKLVLFVFLLYGYILGRIDAWFGYSPLRRDLRRQKKANKALNKEQEKLNETVSGLKQDIAGLQEKVKKETDSLITSEESNLKNWWNNFKQKISAKKGN